MSVASSSVPAARPWIWGARADLGWILLCPVLCFAVLHAVWRQQAFSDRNLYAVMFCFVVNAHHMPASLRAFGEPTIYRRYRARLWTALLCIPLLAMVPFTLGAGMAVLTVVAVFDLWHVAMQQHGLGRIYAAKAGERGEYGARLDLACTLCWYATVVVLSDSWMAGIASTLQSAGLPLFDAFSPAGWGLVKALFGALSALLLVAYAREALRSRRAGAPVAWLKHALHGVAFGVLAWSYQDPSWYRAQSTQNAFHALQYFFIVWIYGHLASSRDPLAYPQVYTGLFARRRGILRFALLLLLYGLFFYVLRAARTGLQLGALAPAQLPLIPEAWSSEHTMEMLASVSIASLLVHFYVDSFIWKVRSKTVRSTLRIDVPPQAQAQAQASDEPAEGHLRGIAHALGYFGVPIVLVGVLGAARATDGPNAQLRSLQHAAVLFPRSAAALTVYGEAALDASDRAAGRAALMEAARLSPSYQGPARALWTLARREHQPKDALRWGQQALAAQPEDAHLRYRVALQLVQAGRTDEARGELEQLLSIRRGDRRALHGLAMLALRDDDAAGAEGWLQRTGKGAGDPVEAARLLFEPAGDAEVVAKSRATLERYAEQHPGSRLAAAWGALSGH